MVFLWVVIPPAYHSMLKVQNYINSVVADFESAASAAHLLMRGNIENVLITAGAKGAYLFTSGAEEHIHIPDIAFSSAIKDETGCGDQTTATISAMLLEGKNMAAAARLGVISGTLQFHTSGIVPVKSEELKR